METDLTFAPADDDQWREYDGLATRSYGHPVPDIALLRPHVDTRVALLEGQVVAGGLGFLTGQYFGGRPVPSACLGSGCVAPEHRGRQLAVPMLTERIRVLREQGAVLATVWTTSTGYARRLGWQAPAPVFTWSVPTDALKRSFTSGQLRIEHDPNPACQDLQADLAPQWNGPLARPAWWAPLQHAKHNLQTYRFIRTGGELAGYLSLNTGQHPQHGTHLVVHELWATDQDAAVQMLAFLGRHNSRIKAVFFQRTALPPAPLLLHHLHQYAAATAQAWQPWMLRILDPVQAVRLRGWPADTETEIPIAIGPDAADRYLLRIAAGHGDLTPSDEPPKVTFTPCQFAAWYAGGYRTAAAARLAGLQGTDETLTLLVRATADLDPWLPDHF